MSQDQNVKLNGLERKDLMNKLFEHYIDENDHEMYTRCKLCQDYTQKDKNLNFVQLMGHLTSNKWSHQFSVEKICKLVNKAVVPIKIISNEADRKLTDAIMQIVKEGLPFSHVVSDEYRRLTNTWYTRQDIAQEINNRAEKIALNQFNRYPVVPDNANFMTRVQALLIWDGFMCTYTVLLCNFVYIYIMFKIRQE
ncbi:Hypothetical_protein [Hexamita inflata]|uniref:Hypothetical_protein n=1 Tax=Hexamita inflata TaxID=28002 RepID=A0AA86R8S1_9EUKA|nr:Hypothetical protein HINF_LOCUS59277 [Hexamita inflata]